MQTLDHRRQRASDSPDQRNRRGVPIWIVVILAVAPIALAGFVAAERATGTTAAAPWEVTRMVRRALVDPNDYGFVEVHCPKGTQVISTGFQTQRAGGLSPTRPLKVYTNAPVIRLPMADIPAWVNGEIGQNWWVMAYNPNPERGRIIVYATCAAITALDRA